MCLACARRHIHTCTQPPLSTRVKCRICGSPSSPTPLGDREALERDICVWSFFLFFLSFFPPLGDREALARDYGCMDAAADPYRGRGGLAARGCRTGLYSGDQVCQ
jgi:hypothetical protein